MSPLGKPQPPLDLLITDATLLLADGNAQQASLGIRDAQIADTGGAAGAAAPVHALLVDEHAIRAQAHGVCEAVWRRCDAPRRSYPPASAIHS